jgi:ATP-dependent exoDNAse (exonuclease V) alpha subunit
MSVNSSSTFTPCQQKAHAVLTDGNANIFLTGCAGSGKSYLIREFLKQESRETFPVLASTGAAAVLVGGRTFHSFFGIGILEGGVEAAVKKAIKDKRVVKRLRACNGMVIDEVSMLPGAALEAAEAVARSARQKNLPWGGLRVITVGDFAQLPPVSRSGPTDWAFQAPVWQNSEFDNLVLNTVTRTADADFAATLDDVRQGRVTERVKNWLNERLDPEADVSDMTVLMPRRDQAEKVNLVRLQEIEGEAQVFPTQYEGESRAIDSLKRNAPVPEQLALKIGARVMIRVNDQGFRYVNGTTAVVAGITKDEITVVTSKGREFILEPVSFAWQDAEGNVTASAKNFPLNLAYAATIHKAQGATLDRVMADLRNLWDAGQAYVAVSRVRRPSDLTLSGWSEKSVRMDESVRTFYAGLRSAK